MKFPGNRNAFKPDGASVPTNPDRQIRVESPPIDPANSSSTNAPSVGAPSRLGCTTDTSPFSFIALPTDVLCHTLGFLDSMEIVLLSRASKALYTISGAMQRSVPADHWHGGSIRRTIEQRELTRDALRWQQADLKRKRSEAVQTVVPIAPAALQELQAIESQAKVDTFAQAFSLGSRFRHLSFSMNDDPLVHEIGEALSNAVGWQHLELIVSSVKPLARFLLQLTAGEVARRAAIPANAGQPVRELSICLQPSRALFSEAEIPHIVHVLKALQHSTRGLRVASLKLPQQNVSNFIDFIAENPYIKQIVAAFDADATPFLEALRASRPALRSLSLSFSQVDFQPPALESLFSQSDEWQFDWLSISASKMAASLFPPAFLASCKIRELQLVGLDFDQGLEVFGAALARNAVLEKIEFGYCRFPGDRDVINLLNRLRTSTSLRCLKLRENVRRGNPLVSRHILDCIKAWSCLSELHIDQTIFSRNMEAITQLQHTRPCLKIFIGEQLFESSDVLLQSNWRNADSDHETDVSTEDLASGDDSTDSCDEHAAQSDDSLDRCGADSSDADTPRDNHSRAAALRSLTGDGDLVDHNDSMDLSHDADSPRAEGSEHDQAPGSASGDYQQDFMADIDQVIQRAKDAEKQ